MIFLGTYGPSVREFMSIIPHALQVWARLHSGLWWPGEMLDPFHLPPARSLPLGAAAGERWAISCQIGSKHAPVMALIDM